MGSYFKTKRLEKNVGRLQKPTVINDHEEIEVVCPKIIFTC